MKRALLVVLAAFGACWLVPGGTSVESAKFPGVQIECGGEASLPANVCRDWGERALAGPGLAQGQAVTRLVLTFRTGNSRCAADFYGADGRLLATAAARCPRP